MGIPDFLEVALLVVIFMFQVQVIQNINMDQKIGLITLHILDLTIDISN